MPGIVLSMPLLFNILGRDNISNAWSQIPLNEIHYTLIQISPKHVPNGDNDNNLRIRLGDGLAQAPVPMEV